MHCSIVDSLLKAELCPSSLFIECGFYVQLQTTYTTNILVWKHRLWLLLFYIYMVFIIDQLKTENVNEILIIFLLCFLNCLRAISLHSLHSLQWTNKNMSNQKNLHQEDTVLECVMLDRYEPTIKRCVKSAIIGKVYKRKI